MGNQRHSVLLSASEYLDLLIQSCIPKVIPACAVLKGICFASGDRAWGLIACVSVTVTAVQGVVSDTAGKRNLPVSPLSFTRVAYPLLKPTSVGIELSPGQQTLT